MKHARTMILNMSDNAVSVLLCIPNIVRGNYFSPGPLQEGLLSSHPVYKNNLQRESLLTLFLTSAGMLNCFPLCTFFRSQDFTNLFLPASIGSPQFIVTLDPLGCDQPSPFGI